MVTAVQNFRPDSTLRLSRTSSSIQFDSTPEIADASLLARSQALLGPNNFQRYDLDGGRQLVIARLYDRPGSLVVHLLNGNHDCLNGNINFLRSDFLREGRTITSGNITPECKAAISSAESLLRLGHTPVKNILVTGSSGTVGSELVLALTNCGYTVIGVDEQACRFNHHVNPFTIIGDLREASTYKQISERMPKVDLILHLAAEPGVHMSVKFPGLDKKALDAHYAVLEFARESNNIPIGFSSSREVYGKQPRGLVPEDAAPFKHAESPYSWAKVAGEAMMQTWSSCYGMPHTVFRYSNVYGPNENRSSRVMCVWVREALCGNDLTVFGEEDGELKAYSFTHISDAINGTVAIARGMGAPHMRNQAYNVCGPEAVPLHAAAQVIQDIVGKIKIGTSKGAVHLKANRTGEINWFHGDPGKLARHTGHVPVMRFADAMPEVVAGYIKFIEAGHDMVWG